MNKLIEALQQTPIVYITRDIERALGLPLDTKGYYIITNETEFAKSVAASRKNVLLIDAGKPLSTRELLEKQPVVDYIKEIPNAQILVFKNTTLIEKACAERGWPLLNPKATLANTVEEKISQISWLGDLVKYLPPYKIVLLKNLTWQNNKFILQFNRSHTGSGTILITSDSELKKLQAKFPNREARVAPFIDGPLFTNNNAIWGLPTGTASKNVLISEPSYQITGLKPFTDITFATIGNDWALPKKLLSEQQLKEYYEIAKAVAGKLLASGWKGLFGLDVIVSKNEENNKSINQNDRLYLLEINARQPASATFESDLQRSVILNPDSHRDEESPIKQGDPSPLEKLGAQDDKRITTFEAHLAGLLNLKYENEDVAPIADGAQIIKRVTSSSLRGSSDSHRNDRRNPLDKKIASLTKAGFNVIPYNNTKPGEDLLRIQSKTSIMQAHSKFNKIGMKIKKMIER